ncbi:MAG: histidine utilization repressor [Pseudomonadota bacterium]|jgi:GntR family histidine utilization transcriptional repressor
MGKPQVLSLHERILGDIEQHIVSGRWPPGHRIPSEQDLTQQYGCSRMTVNKVLTQLARGGLVERRRKAGSFVTRPQSRSAVLEIQDIRSEVESLGQAYRYEVRERKRRRSTNADMQTLGLGQHSPVLHLVTQHWAGARPFCLEQRLIGLDTVPAAAEQDFSSEAPGAWLVNHVPWTSAEHRIRAVGADAQTAPLLELPLGAPCLLIERRTWLGGQPVTFVRLTYPGDGHELVARFSPSSGSAAHNGS